MVDQLDLAIVALIVLLAVGAVAGDLPTVVRTLLAVPLVLFLPGYALVSALLPTFAIPAIERLLLAVGSSLALSILVGLALGFAAVPLDAVSWSVALTVVTLALIVLAWARRVHRHIVGPRPSLIGMPRRGVALVVLSVLIVADVLLGVRLAASQQLEGHPTQLWLIPDEQDSDRARLGVRADDDGGRYVIEMSTAAVELHRFEFTLAGDQTWQIVVDLAGGLRQDGAIAARLYEDGSDTETRTVVLQPVPDGT